MSEFNEEQLRQALHSESVEDLLSRAAEKHFRAKGFDRKAYNEAVYSKEKQMADSADVRGLTREEYEMYVKNVNYPPSGALPPVPPGDSAVQATTLEKNNYGGIGSYLSGYFSELWNGMLMGISNIIPETYMTIRDRLMSWINGKGRVPNFLSSLYAMAADCGPLRRIMTDPCDRLELLLEEDIIRSIRNYNTRKSPQFLIKRVFKDGKVPRQGRPVEKEDIHFDNQGHLVIGTPENSVGGYPMRPDEIERMEEFYSGESDNEYWVSHGESKTKGLDLSEFRRNLTRFTLSHYIKNKGKAVVKFLGTFTRPGGTKIKLTRMTLPYGYNPIRWDPELFKSTTGYALAYLIAHFPYYIADKIFGALPFGKKGIIMQGELNRMFIPIVLPIYETQDTIYH